MTKPFLCVLSAMFLFLGVIIGFFCSPMKGGMSFGNNSGNNYYAPPDEPICGRCDEDDEDCCSEEIPF